MGDDTKASEYQQQMSLAGELLVVVEADDLITGAKMVGFNPAEDFAGANLGGVNLSGATFRGAESCTLPISVDELGKC